MYIIVIITRIITIIIFTLSMNNFHSLTQTYESPDLYDRKSVDKFDFIIITGYILLLNIKLI